MSTREIANFITGTSFAGMPPEVVDKAQMAISNHLSVMLAAVGDEAVVAAGKMAAAAGGHPEATLIDQGLKATCNLAAMVNAIMAGAVDMDDGAYRPSGHLTHGGRVVVPSALAVAERQDATGKDLITAVVLGYDVTLRVAWSISLNGMYPIAGMPGTYGATAAAAKLLGLSTAEIVQAFGIAGAHCLRLSRVKRMEKVAMTKDAEGWGAMTGVSAALLAKTGFKGPGSIFDAPDFSPDALANLGLEWQILRTYFKRYSGTRSAHAALDGAFDLMRAHGITASDIVKIKVGVAGYATAMTNPRPDSIWNAQYSLPFMIGAGIADDEVGPDQISHHRLNDRSILDQTDKVEVYADAEADALRPGTVPARVTVETRDGSKYETFVKYPKGGPENPFTEAELRDICFKHCNRALGVAETAVLLRCLDALPRLAHVSQLVAKLNPVP